MEAFLADLEAFWSVNGNLCMQYASIPVVASLIGYGTNVLAIQMTFLPLEYFGADALPDGERRPSSRCPAPVQVLARSSS